MKNRRLKLFKENFLNDKIAIICSILLFIIILGAIFAFLSPYDPNHIDVENMASPPTAKHPFGTDDIGRDYLTRTLYGARVTLIVAFCAMLTSTLIGVTVGTISGYFGGIIDSLFMRFIDVLTSIPWLILVIIITIFFKGGILTVIFVIGGLSWMLMARLVRAETLSLKQREYVLYAISSGQSSINIITKHIIPGLLPTVIVSAALFIPQAIVIESTLSYLGFGVKKPTSSWGSMIKGAQKHLQESPYMAIIPGLFILVTVFSINRLADIVRTVVDPRTMGGN